MNKLFVLPIICMVLLIGFTSALEIDNKLTYSKNNMKVDFDNLFGFGKHYGSMELKSHKSIVDINKILEGKDRPVMYYDSNFTEEYPDGFGEVIFTNEKTGEVIEKDYYFAERKYEMQMSGRWINCIDAFTREGCEYIETGLFKSYLGGWERLDSNNIPAGEVRIALITDVEKGDYIDGVWTIAGKKVKKHAKWTESSLLTDIFSSYSLNASSGSTAIDNRHNRDATLINMENEDWQTNCVNGNCLAFNGTDEFVNLTFQDGLKANDSFTLSFWLNTTSTATFSLFGSSNADNILGIFYESGVSDGQISMTVRDGGAGQLFGAFTNTSINDGQFHLFVIGFEQSTNLISVFLDGINQTGLTYSFQNDPTPVDLILPVALCGRTVAAGTDQHCPDGTKMDEVNFWTRLLTETEALHMFETRSGYTDTFDTAPIVTGIIPLNNSNLTTNTVTFSGNASDDINLVNVSLFINGLLNQTNSSPVNASQTNFTVTLSNGVHDWFYSVWDSASPPQQTNSTGMRFTIVDFIENAVFFNSSSFETATESFIVNITTNGTAPTSPILSYNGTNFSGAVTSIGGDHYNLSRTINVPLVRGNKTWSYFFNVGGGALQTTENQQNISIIQLGICNSSLVTPYINITFRNETLAQEEITSTIDSTWTYSLTTLADINKTLIFSNASENANYTFCFNPSDRTINSDLSMSYTNSISQQRTFTLSTALSNVTLTQVLFLLPTALGLFSPFKTSTVAGDTLTDVAAVITRVLGGSTISVTSGSTDGSGFITFFLNPNQVYTATFSKTGFADNIFSFTPTAETRTVVMGTGVGQISNGTTIARGLVYDILPTNTSLNNDTDITFQFSVNTTETVTLMSMNITNSSNNQFLFTSQVGNGTISGVVNTGNQTKLIGTFIVTTSDQTITLKRTWIIGSQFTGDYSLFNQFRLFNDYEFSDFIRILLALLMIMGIMIFITRGELVDTSESKIIIITLLVWAFSIVGWLDTGLVSSSTSADITKLAQFSNQFGIAIITTVFTTYFTFRRVFIRKL